MDGEGLIYPVCNAKDHIFIHHHRRRYSYDKFSADIGVLIQNNILVEAIRLSH